MKPSNQAPKVLIVSLLLIMLAACFAPSAPTPQPPAPLPMDQCGANQYEHLIGQSITKTLDLDFTHETRYFGNNAPIARNSSSPRLNFVTSKDIPLPDADNLIIEVFCG